MVPDSASHGGNGREYGKTCGVHYEAGCSCLVVVLGAEAGIATTEGVFERIVQHGCSHSEEGLHRRPVLQRICCFLFSIRLATISLDRTLDERGRDRFATSTSGRVMHQRAFGYARDSRAGRGRASGSARYRLRHAHACGAPRAAQRRELAPASRPAPVPQAPLRTLQFANRLVGRVSAGRMPPRPRAACSACSKCTAACHQVEHDRGLRQHLTLHPSHSPASPSHSTVAGVSACTASSGERLLERFDAIVGPLRAKAKRDWMPWASITLPAITSKWRSLMPMATADVAAIGKPQIHDGLRCLRRGSALPSWWRAAAQQVFRRPATSCSAPCPAFCAPQIGSAIRTAGLRPCRTAPAPHTAPSHTPIRAPARLAASRQVEDGEALAPPELWQGQVSRRRTRSGTSPNRERNVAGVMTLAGQGRTHTPRTSGDARPPWSLAPGPSQLGGRCERCFASARPEPEVAAKPACSSRVRGVRSPPPSSSQAPVLKPASLAKPSSAPAHPPLP